MDNDAEPSLVPSGKSGGSRKHGKGRIHHLREAKIMPAIGYHFSAKTISRSRGQSAVASASYRTAEKLKDERLDKTFDYTRKQGVELVYHAAPKDAPKWAHDIGQAWNAVEQVENRKNSTVAREFVAAFPHQLDEQQREWMLKDFVREELTRKGFMATSAIHSPSQDGDERNFHVHIMLAERKIDTDGFDSHKDRRFSSFETRAETLEQVKEKWAELGARQLERAGFSIEAERWRHGHESLEKQRAAALARGDLDYAEQCNRKPTQHLGVVATEIERDGRESHRGNENRDIEARNAERQEINEALASIQKQQAALEQQPQKTAREIWIEQRDLDYQIERIEAAQKRPQSALYQEIGRAWTDSNNGEEFVQELQERGLLLCRVSAEDAAKSKNDRALLGTMAYREGEFLAVNEHGHAYRINAETISMTATNTYDHLQNVTERLESVEPTTLPTFDQGKQIVDYFREAVEQDNSDHSHSDDRGIKLGGLAAQGLGAALRVMEVWADGLESFFFSSVPTKPHTVLPHETIIEETPSKTGNQRRLEDNKLLQDPEQSRTITRENMPTKADEDFRERIRRMWEEEERKRSQERGHER